jgi:hypothetical protein
LKILCLQGLIAHANPDGPKAEFDEARLGCAKIQKLKDQQLHFDWPNCKAPERFEADLASLRAACENNADDAYAVYLEEEKLGTGVLKSRQPGLAQERMEIMRSIEDLYAGLFKSCAKK